MIVKFLKSIFKPTSSSKLNPESEYIVTFNDELITCSRPDGIEEEISWNNLHFVTIETTDQGPFFPDVFWLLGSKDLKSGCIIPQGATGEDELLKYMQERLPNFNNDELIKAMGSAKNNKFLIWQKNT